MRAIREKEAKYLRVDERVFMRRELGPAT